MNKNWLKYGGDVLGFVNLDSLCDIILDIDNMSITYYFSGSDETKVTYQKLEFENKLEEIEKLIIKKESPDYAITNL